MIRPKPRDVRRSLRSMLALTLLTQILLPAAVLSQTDMARMLGTVRDQSKAIIQGANIFVKNERTGEERNVTTGEDGTYLIPNLKPSVYTLKVTAQGFKDAEVRGVQLLVGQALTTDIEIKPAGTSDCNGACAHNRYTLTVQLATPG